MSLMWITWKKQTEDRRYDHVFKRYGCRGYRFFENGYVSDHRYSEQSGVYCFQRGSTTIGNGSVRAFVYVQEESFAMDVYTEICIQAAGAKELTAFTSEYEDTVAKAKENIEKIKEQRQKARYTEIVDEANGKIAEAEAEVTDAQTKLENGKAEAAASWRMQGRNWKRAGTDR